MTRPIIETICMDMWFLGAVGGSWALWNAPRSGIPYSENFVSHRGSMKCTTFGRQES